MLSSLGMLGRHAGSPGRVHGCPPGGCLAGAPNSVAGGERMCDPVVLKGIGDKGPRDTPLPGHHRSSSMPRALPLPGVPLGPAPHGRGLAWTPLRTTPARSRGRGARPAQAHPRCGRALSRWWGPCRRVIRGSWGMSATPGHAVVHPVAPRRRLASPTGVADRRRRPAACPPRR